MYEYCIRIAGVYIAGLGITVVYFCALSITWSMLKKKIKGFNTVLENGFCLSQRECSQLLHMMGPSERPQELWGKIRVGLNAGRKSLPARIHPCEPSPWWKMHCAEGRDTPAAGIISREVLVVPITLQHPPALSMSHKISLEPLHRQRGGFHNIPPGVFGFRV